MVKKRQRTRWLATWKYRQGRFVRAGIVSNLAHALDPEDVIRLQTHWLSSDVDWTMRTDEALALINVLSHVVSHYLNDTAWERQKAGG